ncbi:MAG: hypothetical protein VYA30_12540 [Myxococcota bacterium]|nr:hypothetical protein [Myxococcota bacterium]
MTRETQGYPPPLRGFSHLIWPALRGLVNQSKAGRSKERLRLFFFAILGIGFMGLTGAGAYWLFGQFLQAEFLAEILIRRTLDIILVFFFGLLLFSNLIAGFTTLLLADDLTLLMSSPIPSGRLFLTRLVFTWSQSSWMVLVFGVPVFAAVGPVLDAPWWFYMGIPIVLFPFTVMATALGCLATLSLATWLPAKKTRDVLIVLAVVGFLFLYVAFRLAEPERFLQPDGFEDLVSLISGLGGGENVFVPTTWSLEALLALAKGQSNQVLLPLITLLSGAISCLALSAWVSKSIYLRAYDTAQMGRQNQQRDDGSVKAAWFIMTYPNGPLKSLIARDNRLFFRTTSQWTQLLLIGALVIVYLFNFKHFRSLQDAKIINSVGIFFVNYALSGLVVTTLAVRFLFPAISLEGKAFWTVRVAPFPAQTLLWAKVVWGSGPLVILSVILALGSGWITDLPTWMLLFSVVIATLTTLSLVGMAVGLGALWPAFHLDNPTRIASSIGGVFFMLLGASLLILTATLSAPMLLGIRDFLAYNTVPSYNRLSWMVGCTLILLVVLWLTYRVSMSLGAKNLEEGT